MKRITQLILLGLLLVVVGCAFSVPGEKAEPITEDIAEKAPGSLNVVVTEFNWFYINGGTHIRVVGKVKNETEDVYQGVIISGILHDEKGTPIVQGSSYVSPTYLKPDGVGNFEFTGLSRREKGVKAIRLVFTASVKSSQ